jgi:outer membrane protein
LEYVLKKSINLIFVLSALLVSSYAVAADAKKIGVISFRAIMAKAPQNETLRKSIETEFKDRQEKLQAEQTRIAQKEQQLKKDEPIMAPAQVTAAAREIEGEKVQFQLKAKAFEEDYKRRSSELMAFLQKEVANAIKKYAESNGYDLIIDAERTPYVASSMDITEAILKSIQAPGK